MDDDDTYDNDDEDDNDNKNKVLIIGETPKATLCEDGEVLLGKIGYDIGSDMFASRFRSN